MAKKEIEYYEYKEAPMRKAYAYASFGWLIGKHSQHYSKKLDREVVTLRRDIAIGADPTIRECEKEYLKLEKGKLPAKYRNKSFFRILGKIFITLIIVVLLLAGLGMSVVGVYNGIATEKRVRALYNAAVKAEIVADADLVETATKNGSVLPQTYVAFKKDHSTLDTFAELMQLNDGAVSERKVLDAYHESLIDLELAEDDEDSFEKFDPSLIKNEGGEYVASASAINDLIDIVRKYFAFVNFDRTLEGLPVWLNSFTLIGIASLLVFVLLMIVCSIARKKNKKERLRQCALLKRDCLKNAGKALHDLKLENRELMTRKDMRLLDLENMFTQVMSTKEEDDE